MYETRIRSKPHPLFSLERVDKLANRKIEIERVVSEQSFLYDQKCRTLFLSSVGWLAGWLAGRATQFGSLDLLHSVNQLTGLSLLFSVFVIEPVISG